MTKISQENPCMIQAVSGDLLIGLITRVFKFLIFVLVIMIMDFSLKMTNLEAKIESDKNPGIHAKYEFSFKNWIYNNL